MREVKYYISFDDKRFEDKKECADYEARIKAAGGIRDLATIEKMMANGVTRFGIGIRGKFISLLLKFNLQFLVILNDTVVNQSNVFCHHRMSILFRGFAMGRPSRMPDADRS